MKLSLDRMGVRASDLIIEPKSTDKSAKVLHDTLDKALAKVTIEWME
jgi:hypothetical protein